MLKNVFKSIKVGDSIIINKNLTGKKCSELASVTLESELGHYIHYNQNVEYAGQVVLVDRVDTYDSSFAITVPDGRSSWVPYRATRKIRSTDKV